MKILGKLKGLKNPLKHYRSGTTDELQQNSSRIQENGFVTKVEEQRAKNCLSPEWRGFEV